jgi:hypothetical protein
MARRNDIQLPGPAATSVATVAGAGTNPASLGDCTCEEFRRTHVCDHVIMAAVVRMIHRMIEIRKDDGDQKPH